MIKRIARIFSVILVFALMGNVVYAAEGKSQEGEADFAPGNIEDIFTFEKVDNITGEVLSTAQYECILDDIEIFETMGLMNTAQDDAISKIEIAGENEISYTLAIGEYTNEIVVIENDNDNLIFSAKAYQDGISNDISYDSQGRLWIDGICYENSAEDQSIIKCASSMWYVSPPYGNSATYKYYGGSLSYPDIEFNNRVQNLTISAFVAIFTAFLSPVLAVVVSLCSLVLTDYYTNLKNFYPMQTCASMTASIYNPYPNGVTYINNSVGFVQEYNFRFYAYTNYKTLLNAKTAYYQRTVY